MIKVILVWDSLQISTIITLHYTMLRDKDGTPINFPKYKSDYELERLKELGLMDESFN